MKQKGFEVTQFSQIELIYNRLLNLITEISSLIKDEEYSMASEKVELQEKLVKQFASAQKTVNLTTEEKNKIQTMETTIREKNDTMLADLQKLRAELAGEVKETKSKIKLSSAYEPQPMKRQGDLIDISE